MAGDRDAVNSDSKNQKHQPRIEVRFTVSAGSGRRGEKTMRRVFRLPGSIVGISALAQPGLADVHPRVVAATGNTDGRSAGDLDFDGDVDLTDLALVLAAFGNQCGG
jgi:hypothetical protein